jgi:site-specific recombinase XerD
MADQPGHQPDDLRLQVGDERIPDADADGITALHGLVDMARRYARAGKADNTRRAYGHDWRQFVHWCEDYRLQALPAAPSTLCLYLSALAEWGRKASTIERRMAAISQAHQAAGHVPSPTLDWQVRTVMGGIRRRLGTAPSQKTALETADVRRLLAATPEDTLGGRRDRALLLLGFAGGFRRSELVGLYIEDLEESEYGLRVRLRRSKTGQEGEGDVKGIPWGSHLETCPVLAVRAWLEASGITEGPLFRAVDRHGRHGGRRLGDRAAAEVVKRAAKRAGLDPASYAAHSLRSGHATSAAAGGAPERAIMRQTGHRSLQTLRGYIRSGTIWRENAAAYLGL